MLGLEIAIVVMTAAYLVLLGAGLYKAEKAEKNDMMLYINDIADNDFVMNVQHGYKMARTLL